MISRPRKLVARDHREAYDFWATHFSDPALMANRDRETTRQKIARLVEQLRLSPNAAVLDVGPGDGALFQQIAGRVRRCCGVDPSEAAVAKLGVLFKGQANVEFKTGTAEEIPYADASFDVVVINSVLHSLPSLENVDAAIGEAARVCKPGGLIFVGELPFRSELDRGILLHLSRKLREFGVRALARNLWATYVRPILRGEPVVLYPATNLHLPQREFTLMCLGHGLSVETRRHRELARPSLTRNDYLLRSSTH